MNNRETFLLGALREIHEVLLSVPEHPDYVLLIDALQQIDDIFHWAEDATTNGPIRVPTSSHHDH